MAIYLVKKSILLKGKLRGQCIGVLPVLLLLLCLSLLLLAPACGNNDDSSDLSDQNVQQSELKIPHAVAGQQNCLACHGPSVVWPMPDNHDGRELADCGKCHGNGSLDPHAVPHNLKLEKNKDCISCHHLQETYHRRNDNQTCMMCHQVPVGSPPAITHDLAENPEMKDCVKCHSGDDASMPASHDAWGAPCDTCHTFSSGTSTTTGA